MRRPKHYDPRIVAQISEAIHNTGEVHGDIDKAVLALLQTGLIKPNVLYKEVPGKKTIEGVPIPEVGELYSWHFRNDRTGNGRVVEIVKIVKRVTNGPLWANSRYLADMAEVRNLSTGRRTVEPIGEYYRKVELI